MARTLFSNDWYRVADLKPRLRAHVEIHRQRFRGERWYVIEDRQAGQFHRLAPSGYLMLTLMNGRRTMQQIWEALGERLGTEQPAQDDCILLLTQLWQADLLSAGGTPDLAEIDRRAGQQQRRQILSRVKNPMALRFPLFDPDRFLDRTAPLVTPLFGPAGFVLWLALLAAGVALAALHWPDLTHNLADRVLSAGNILMIALIYPLVKALHELGHGYATKRWGGAVHEIGIMLLVLMPVPYVDASSALAFPEKWRRAVVGAAGIMVELALAAIAMIVWVMVEDGLIRAAAFNVMLISGISTLLFNGNPLLRFDGYYVLCDLIESPNLGTRANAYFFYLVQRYLFGATDAVAPLHTASERKWLLGYAVLSCLYRISIVLGIALSVATRFFFIGVILALWALAALAVWPLLQGVRFLAVSPRLRRRRGRAVLTTGLVLGAAAVLLFVVPVPYGTMAQGVVLDPPGAQIRAGTDGQVAELLVAPNAVVEEERVLLRLENPELAGQLAILRAERSEAQFRLEASIAIDPVQARLERIRLENLDARLATLEERQEALTVRAPRAGRVVLPSAESLVGRYFHRSDQLGTIAALDDPVVRVIVPQGDIDLIRGREGGVGLRFADSPDRIRPARVSAQVPASVDTLPSRALARGAGGPIPVDPTDPEGLRPLNDVFQLDLRLAAPDVDVAVGQRAFVRFDHGPEPVARRIWRSTRQLLLGLFNV